MAHAQHELGERERVRAIARATKTVATVRHEREQGDEEGEREREASIVVTEKRRPERETWWFLTHAQHELRTVAARRMPDGGERENSTWSAGGRRDEIEAVCQKKTGGGDQR